jgi:hypothetical protein
MKSDSASFHEDFLVLTDEPTLQMLSTDNLLTDYDVGTDTQEHDAMSWVISSEMSMLISSETGLPSELLHHTSDGLFNQEEEEGSVVGDELKLNEIDFDEDLSEEERRVCAEIKNTFNNLSEQQEVPVLELRTRDRVRKLCFTDQRSQTSFLRFIRVLQLSCRLIQSNTFVTKRYHSKHRDLVFDI